MKWMKSCNDGHSSLKCYYVLYYNVIVWATIWQYWPAPSSYQLYAAVWALCSVNLIIHGPLMVEQWPLTMFRRGHCPWCWTYCFTAGSTLCNGVFSIWLPSSVPLFFYVTSSKSTAHLQREYHQHTTVDVAAALTPERTDGLCWSIAFIGTKLDSYNVIMESHRTQMYSDKCCRCSLKDIKHPQNMISNRITIRYTWAPSLLHPPGMWLFFSYISFIFWILYLCISLWFGNTEMAS